MFTILHLSDLHRSEADRISNVELLSALIADSKRFPYETPRISLPDAVVVSGDLIQGTPIGHANSPKELERQYKEALEFLRAIADAFLSGDRSRLIVVPGNHDVDFNASRAAMQKVDMEGKNVLALLQAPDSLYRWSWKERQLYQICDPQKYASRLEMFRQTAESFYHDVHAAFPLDFSRPWNLFSLDQGRIVVATFNSCERNDCFNHAGAISPSAIAESYLQLERSRIVPSLRIAVWHHDLQGPPNRNDYMDADMVRLMIDRGYRLGLHGHDHKSEASVQKLWTSEEQEMAVVSAGSLCAAAHEIPPGFRRQYNVIEVASNYETARIHVRHATLPGVFCPGTLLATGNSSFMDVKWSPVPLGMFVNAGRGGGQALAILEEVEILSKNGAHKSALALLERSKVQIGAPYHAFRTKILLQMEDWAGLVSHLAPPRNSDDLAICVRAFLEMKRFEEADALLASAENDGEYSSTLMRDLKDQIRATRLVSQ